MWIWAGQSTLNIRDAGTCWLKNPHAQSAPVESGCLRWQPQMWADFFWCKSSFWSLFWWRVKFGQRKFMWTPLKAKTAKSQGEKTDRVWVYLWVAKPFCLHWLEQGCLGCLISNVFWSCKWETWVSCVNTTTLLKSCRVASTLGSLQTTQTQTLFVKVKISLAEVFLLVKVFLTNLTYW